jgi:hypothetical protein
MAMLNEGKAPVRLASRPVAPKMETSLMSAEKTAVRGGVGDMTWVNTAGQREREREREREMRER